eukprot:1158785-Pelagomonas_calceolata.AAC.3
MHVLLQCTCKREHTHSYTHAYARAQKNERITTLTRSCVLSFCSCTAQYDKESEADRMLLIKVLLHAADIGNAVSDIDAVRPFHVNQIMSRRVHKEFEAQARDEAAAGLPITFAVDSNNPRMCAQVVSDDP